MDPYVLLSAQYAVELLCFESSRAGLPACESSRDVDDYLDIPWAASAPQCSIVCPTRCVGTLWCESCRAAWLLVAAGKLGVSPAAGLAEMGGGKMQLVVWAVHAEGVTACWCRWGKPRKLGGRGKPSGPTLPWECPVVCVPGSLDSFLTQVGHCLSWKCCDMTKKRETPSCLDEALWLPACLGCHVPDQRPALLWYHNRASCECSADIQPVLTSLRKSLKSHGAAMRSLQSAFCGGGAVLSAKASRQCLQVRPAAVRDPDYLAKREASAPPGGFHTHIAKRPGKMLPSAAAAKPPAAGQPPAAAKPLAVGNPPAKGKPPAAGVNAPAKGMPPAKGAQRGSAPAKHDEAPAAAPAPAAAAAPASGKVYHWPLKMPRGQAASSKAAQEPKPRAAAGGCNFVLQSTSDCTEPFPFCSIAVLKRHLPMMYKRCKFMFLGCCRVRQSPLKRSTGTQKRPPPSP